MKQKLTLKNLILVTVISLILTAAKFLLESRFGNWVSPSDVKFWLNDIAIVIAWILYFIEQNKK